MNDINEIREFYKELEKNGFIERTKNRFWFFFLLTLVLFTFKLTVLAWLSSLITSTLLLPILATYILNKFTKEHDH